MSQATPGRYSLGIDIGGTKMAAGIVDFSGDVPRVVHTLTTPTPSYYKRIGQWEGELTQSSYLEVLDTLVADARSSGYQIDTIGVGAPGVINPTTGTVIHAGPTMPGWEGTPLGEHLAHTGLPTAIHNDVRVLGLAEAHYGAGRGHHRVLFVSLGTGVGGAIIDGGTLIPSPHHTAGELRGLIGPHPAGMAAPIETFGSGPGIEALYTHRSGTRAELRDIVAAAEAGNTLAAATISDCMLALGRTLGGAFSFIDADAIIIGGGVASIGNRILDPLTIGFTQAAVGPAATIPLTPASLGLDSPLIGAALLGRQQL